MPTVPVDATITLAGVPYRLVGGKITREIRGPGVQAAAGVLVDASGEVELLPPRAGVVHPGRRINGLPPTVGTPCAVTVTVGGVVSPLLTDGITGSPSGDIGSGAVSVDVSDGIVERLSQLRGPWSMLLAAPVTTSGERPTWGLTPEGVAIEAARVGGFPAYWTGPDTILHVPLAGSVRPSREWPCTTAAPATTPENWIAPWGMASDSGEWTPAWAWESTAASLELTVWVGTTAAREARLSVRKAGGTVLPWVRVASGVAEIMTSAGVSSGQTLPHTAGTPIGLHLTLTATTVTATLRTRDGATVAYTEDLVVPLNDVANWTVSLAGHAAGVNRAPVGGLTVDAHAGTAPTWSGVSHVPQFVVHLAPDDRSWWVASPSWDDATPLRVLLDIASAGGVSMWRAPDGVLHWWGRLALLGQPVAATITTADAVAGISWTGLDRSVAVTVTGRIPTVSVSPTGRLILAEGDGQPIEYGAPVSLVLHPDSGQDWGPIDTTAALIDPATASVAPGTCFGALVKDDATGTVIRSATASDLTCTVRQLDPRSVLVELTSHVAGKTLDPTVPSSNTRPGMAGRRLPVLCGYAATSWQEVSTQPSAPASEGLDSVEVQAGWYWQTMAGMERLRDSLVEPLPGVVLGQMSVVYDPVLQVGAKVSVVDVTRTDTAWEAVIVRTETTVGPGELTHTLDLNVTAQYRTGFRVADVDESHRGYTIGAIEAAHGDVPVSKVDGRHIAGTESGVVIPDDSAAAAGGVPA